MSSLRSPIIFSSDIAYHHHQSDPHKEGDSHWVAIRLTPRSSSAHYFDSYTIVPLVPSIEEFIFRNCTTWDYNRRQVQGLTSEVYGKYCCLLVVYMDRRYTPSTLMRSSKVGATQTDRWR